LVLIFVLLPNSVFFIVRLHKNLKVLMAVFYFQNGGGTPSWIFKIWKFYFDREDIEDRDATGCHISSKLVKQFLIS